MIYVCTQCNSRTSEEISHEWRNKKLWCDFCKCPTQWNRFPKPKNGSPAFYELLKEAAEIHDKKSHDYANSNNPFGNYHFAGKLSLLFSHSELDAGFIGRIGEKLYRLANLESSGKTALNESIEDTERDLVTIMVLWMADRRERRMKSSTKPRDGNIEAE